MHTEYSYESDGERSLEIGPHLPKLLSNIRWLSFWDTLYISYLMLISPRMALNSLICADVELTLYCAKQL